MTDGDKAREAAYQELLKQPELLTSGIHEYPLECVGCQKPMGFIAQLEIIVPECKHLVRVRAACPDCGEGVASLSLQTAQGSS